MPISRPTMIVNSGVKAIRRWIAVRLMAIICMNLRRRLYDRFPTARAVVADSSCMMGLSTMRAREKVTPNAARFDLTEDIRAIMAVTNGSSTAIITDMAAKGSQNHRMRVWVSDTSFSKDLSFLPVS